MRSDAEIYYAQGVRCCDVATALRPPLRTVRSQLSIVFPLVFTVVFTVVFQQVSTLCGTPWIANAYGDPPPTEQLPAPLPKSPHKPEDFPETTSLTPPQLDTLFLRGKSVRLAEAIAKPIPLAPLDAATPPSVVSDSPVGEAQSAPSGASTVERNQASPTQLTLPLSDNLENNQTEKSQEAPNSLVAFARLRLKSGEATELILDGPEFSVLQGEQTVEWVVGTVDKTTRLSTRLSVLVTSKPGVKWQFSTRVLLDSRDSSADSVRGVEVSPKSVDAVLKRLQSYDRWLLEASEEWKSLSAAQRGRDAADALAKSRLLGARQKNSERSLKRWLEVDAVSKPLFESAYLDLVVVPVVPRGNVDLQSTDQSQGATDPVHDAVSTDRK